MQKERDTRSFGHLHNVTLAKPKNTTVTRQRENYKEALAKIREAQKTAVAWCEIVTQSISLKDRVRQRDAHSQLHSQQHSQQESQQSRITERVRGATIQIKVGGRQTLPLTGGTGGKTGTRRNLQCFDEISATRDSDHHVCDQMCKPYTTVTAHLHALCFSHFA